MAYLFIAHNLPVVSYFSDRVLVLYRGRIMESGPAAGIHDQPAHPYSQALRAAVPVPRVAEQRNLRALRQSAVRVTTAQAKAAPDQGCPFAPRCPYVADVCWTKRPTDASVRGQDRRLPRLRRNFWPSQCRQRRTPWWQGNSNPLPLDRPAAIPTCAEHHGTNDCRGDTCPFIPSSPPASVIWTA